MPDRGRVSGKARYSRLALFALFRVAMLLGLRKRG
jgi:hypothetical protein